MADLVLFSYETVSSNFVHKLDFYFLPEILRILIIIQVVSSQGLKQLNVVNTGHLYPDWISPEMVTRSRTSCSCGRGG